MSEYGYSGRSDDGLIHRYDTDGNDMGVSSRHNSGYSSETGGLIEDEGADGDTSREDTRKDSLIGGFLNLIGFGPNTPVFESVVEWDEDGGVGETKIRTVDKNGQQSILTTGPEYVEPPSSSDDDDKDDFKFFIFF